MTRFTKRTYTGFGDVLRDAGFFVANAWPLLKLAAGIGFPPAFRERLMLTVTGVNRCRYCSYVHEKAALLHGIDREESALLRDGLNGSCPEHELPALAYARLWAANNGAAEPEARRKLEDTYGAALAGKIELVLRAMRAGNLLGNTFDYCLYRVSSGRWGA